MTTYDDGANDQDALIARIAAESASEHAAEEENLKLVRDTFGERVSAAIESGEVIIPDAVLDNVRQMMVAAGRNRRTTVALFNEDDAFRVLDETLRNQAEVNQAAQITNADVMASLPYLRRNGSIGQSIDAGDMPGLT